MKRDYTGIEQYYAMREQRLKDKISKLESQINDLDVIIKEQNVEIKRLQFDNKYQSELIERITKYSDTNTASKPTTKVSLFNRLFGKY